MTDVHLEDIDGIGSTRAENLRRAGYETLDSVRAADEELLRQVRGLGKRLVRRVKSRVENQGTALELDDDRFVVSGRIEDEETAEAGVHGLLVEILGGEDVDARLATVRTNQRGEFGATFTESDHGTVFDRLTEGETRIAVRIHDRDDNVIHSTEADPSDAERGEVTWIEVTLGAEALANHRSRPVTMEPPEGPLVPQEVWQDMDEAVGLLAEPGDTGYNAYRKAVKCPGPPLDDFGGSVLADGWETGGGDIDAADRFREIMNTLMAYQGERDLGGGVELSISDIERSIEAHDEGGQPALTSDVASSPRQRRSATVDDATVVALVLGAAGASGGDREWALRSLRAVGEQLCATEVVGNFHRAARDALGGGNRARQRWEGFVRRGVAECGPDDGPTGGDDGPGFPLPPRKPPDCVPSLDKYGVSFCYDDAIRKITEAGAIPGSGTRYLVTDVTPQRACPGDVITITGQNFGSHPGRVYFDHSKSGTILSWTDSKIRVRVPPGAGCGLRLSIKTETVQICGEFVDIYRQGNVQVNFGGTAAHVHDLRVNGDHGPVRVDPDSTARISWDTCAADTIRIEVRSDTGRVLATHTPTTATGHWHYQVPKYDQTAELTVECTVTGQCQPTQRQQSLTMWVHKVPAPSVDGMEVTQSIQHYGANQHLTDAADRGPDNSIQLVSGKPAMVRVYLRSGQDPAFNDGNVTDVTGQLTVEQFQNGSWNTVTTLSPANAGGTVTARDNPAYTTERGSLSATLNFAAPGNQMQGRVRFSVDVSAPDPYEGTLTATDSTTQNASLQQTLQLAGIMVGYNGPDVNGNPRPTIPAPNIGNLQTAAAPTYDMFPVAAMAPANVRIAGTIMFSQPLTGSIPQGGGCPQSWSNLMSQLRNVMTADPNQNGWVFYGLIAAGTPGSATGVVGCGGNGLGTASVTRPLTLAHEVGHALGLAHAPCGNPANVDGNYPAYEPYDSSGNRQAVIGPYGVSLRNGAVQGPRSRDLMSYCGNNWISKYHYNNLLNVGLLSPAQVGPSRTTPYADGGAEESRHRISITGNVDNDGAIHVQTVARIETTLDLSDAVPTDAVAELLDESGEVVASAPVYALPQDTQTERSCGCGSDGAVDEPPYAFQALLADRAPGAELRIRDGEAVRWDRSASEFEPTVAEVEAAVDAEGQLSMEWVAESAGEERPEFWVRWSDDEGETWSVLTVGLDEPSLTIDGGHLPAGPVVFEVLMHDGFYTATTVSDPIAVPSRSPSVEITHPTADEAVHPDAPLRLAAMSESGARETPDDAYVWFLDGEEVATGRDVFVGNPGRGEHEVTLRVETDAGEATRTVEFEVATENGG